MTRHRPVLEALEDRCVPATWNNPWPDAAHLTLSFVPDGTSLGGPSSNLFATLDAIAPRAVWQREVLRAFQSWLQYTAVNIGLVGDGGQELGTTGRTQGDSRFGDIRIGAAAYGNSVLAFSSPFDPLAGTWSGDVRLNTARKFSVGGAGGVDLFTALLQEAGHVLGLNNSADSTSAMYEGYLGPRSGLSAGDIALIQGLYGARQPDAHEGSGGNETLATATQLGALQNIGGVLALAFEADLTTASDRDVYSFYAPTLTGGMVIRLERAGLSLVTPRVTVYDANGRVVGSVASTGPTGGDLELRLTGVMPLGRYYVAVEAADQDFSVGSYRMSVQNLTLVNAMSGNVVAAAESLVEALTLNDLHTNDSIATAQALAPLVGGLSAAESRFDHAFRAAISDGSDVDFYKVTAPAGLGGDRTLTVMAWGTAGSQLLPRVNVFDAAGGVVPAEVLVREGGTITIQATGVTPGAPYYVKVEAGPAGAPTGNYFLGVDFGTTAAKMLTFADSQLDAARPQESGKLRVKAAALFHFVLSAEVGTGTGVEMTITDKAGNVVRRVRVAAGEWVSLTLTLVPGEYEFRFAQWRADGKALTPVRYKLRGARVSDPIGPQPEDTSSSPSSSPPSESSQTQSSGSSSYYWYESNYYYWSGPEGSSQSSGGPSSQPPSSSGYSA